LFEWCSCVICGVYVTNGNGVPMVFGPASWQVQFINAGPAATQRASNFGLAATADQERASLGTNGEGLPGTDAYARALVGVGAKGLELSEEVSFSRPFRLQDSVNGWDVSLFGVIQGVLSTSGSLNPVASVFANADILDNANNPLATIRFVADFKNQIITEQLTTPQEAIAAVPDGNYAV